jgi:hypothetical protein
MLPLHSKEVKANTHPQAMIIIMTRCKPKQPLVSTKAHPVSTKARLGKASILTRQDGSYDHHDYGPHSKCACHGHHPYPSQAMRKNEL